MTPYAAIDCGTNAIRLLIAEVDSDGTSHELDRQMLTVRLGEGIDASGEFSDAALARTFAAVDEYAARIAECHVGAVRMVATSASRDARNAAVFVDGVRDRLGVVPEVISGEQEAALSFLGAVRGLAGLTSPLLVADIGGGSTELVRGNASTTAINASFSMNIGCVRMTERHLYSDPPTRAEIQQTMETIDAAVSQALDVVPVSDVTAFVGLAGTVTTIAAMAHGLKDYDPSVIHGLRTSYSQVHEVTEELLTMTRRERAAVPVMHPGRVDVIGGGALVLDRLMSRLPVSDVIAGETDILDGIVYTLARNVT